MPHPLIWTTVRITWTLFKLTSRFIAGRPLDGVPRTDAGFLRPGRRPLTATGHASRWAMLPGWKRAAWRLSALTIPITGLELYQLHPAILPAAVITVGLLLRPWWRRRRFRAHYLTPVRRALHDRFPHLRFNLHIDPALGNLTQRLIPKPAPATERFLNWYGRRLEPVVRWLPDRAREGRQRLTVWVEPARRAANQFRRPTSVDPTPQIRLTFPDAYLIDEERNFINSLIVAKVPVPGLDGRWNQVGPNATAAWKPRPRPPREVSYADITAAMNIAAEHEYVLGLQAGHIPYKISVDHDSPHIALSAITGGGKSVMAKLIVAQTLHRGGTVDILDIKGSHRFARQLPGVQYHRSIESIHDALIAAAATAHQRNHQAFDMPEDWDPGPRHLILVEELNSTIRNLKSHWATIRTFDQPKASPAVEAFVFLLQTGRSAKHHVVAVAQLLTALAVAGPEARENFGIRGLANYTTNAWRMLAGDVPMPRKSSVRGRWQIVTAGKTHEVQVAYLTDAQARAHACAGVSVPERARVSESNLSSNVTSDPDKMTLIGDMKDPLDETVTLREACEEGTLAWSYDAAKKRIQRARGDGRPVPPTAGKRGLADLYHRGDLVIWSTQEERVS